MSVIRTITPGILTVGTYGAFAPLCWRDGDKARGRDIDFLRAFATKSGLEFTAQFFEFDRIWERPGRDEIDVAAASIAPLASRTSPGMMWSDPYFTVQRSLLIRSVDRYQLKTMADFGGRVIGVTQGSTADVDTDARRPLTTRVVYLDDQDRAVDALLRGEIDGFGTGDVCSEYLADSHPGQLAVSDVHQMEIPETFAFAVRESGGLLDPLNEFIRTQSNRY
ncbi:MAG: transporter substrate-binding domain-containing protein [Chloroflexota bacterium]